MCMRLSFACIYIIIACFLPGCNIPGEKKITQPWSADTTTGIMYNRDTNVEQRNAGLNYPGEIITGQTTPEALLAFAKTQVGVPYLYGSADPSHGFDCSGFITYVFNHFNIGVPRSSVEFTNIGEEIQEELASPGDLILFTGTDSSVRVVGHMGIIVSNENNQLQFIHSTSGKAWGVTITPLNEYYKGRLVKVIRVFQTNI